MYLSFATSALQTRLAYRSQIWAQVIGYFIEVSAKVAVWVAVYGGVAAVSGVSLPQMVTYAIIGGSVQVGWQWDIFIRTVGAQIKSGDVAVYLLKPLHYPLMLLAGECGNTVFRLIAVVAPVTLAGGFLYGFTPPASLAHAALFVPMWLLGFLILFLLAAIAAFLSFWLMTVFSLEWTLSSLLAVLSGRVVPLWFFPEPAAAVFNYLPFAWVGFHPTAVYLGQVGIPETFGLLAMGLGWVALLSAIVTLLWRRASRRLVVQGG
jgi:ABC-2 type transport system permease protein